MPSTKDGVTADAAIYLPTRLASALILYCNQPGLRVVYAIELHR